MIEYRCGAKIRSGKPCKSSGMANDRCRMHGSVATAAPKGNQNAWTHCVHSGKNTENTGLLARLEFDERKFDFISLCFISNTPSSFERLKRCDHQLKSPRKSGHWDSDFREWSSLV
ncbi:HGGxSTG domain-containing protein [Parasphingorhabdus sp.]|uniref:HGGxSTG domain-containing protein n=1 Tax=Parasphingorhabdus sp. TaxID=2709688 RepID=UPI003D2BFF0B